MALAGFLDFLRGNQLTGLISIPRTRNMVYSRTTCTEAAAILVTSHEGRESHYRKQEWIRRKQLNKHSRDTYLLTFLREVQSHMTSARRVRKTAIIHHSKALIISLMRCELLASMA